MKTAIAILITALLLCGCHKTRLWEYKVVELENSAHHLVAGSVDLSGKYLDAQKEPGDFKLDSLEAPDAFNTDLNNLGSDGWELIAAVPQTETEHPVDKSPSNIRTGKIILIFKRPAK